MFLKNIKNSNFVQKISKFNKKLDSKSLFEKQINKIKIDWLKKYLIGLLSYKTIFYKSIYFILIALVVFVSGFLVRDFAINLVVDTKQTEHGSIFYLTLNNGVALGAGSNLDPVAIYFLQSIPIIVGFFAFVFTIKWWYYIPILFLVFGGLGNVIDRSIPEYSLVGIEPFTNQNTGGGNDIFNGVVDYWRFANSVINLFDVYIVVSICFLILSIIIEFIFSFNKDKNKNQKDKTNIEDTEIVEVSNKQFGYIDEDLKKFDKEDKENEQQK